MGAGAILFDFDGVIVDSERLHWETMVEAMEKRQTQPALASGIITRPLAGIVLIQQPRRCPAKCSVPLSVSRS